MFVYQGKTALITGASSGIGRAFARALAERGMSVVLVARSEERLRALATELSQRYGIRAEVIPADLSLAGAARQIQQEVERRDLALDLLVNNAGFGLNGFFETLSPERDHQQVMVDVAAVVDLTHAFVPSTRARPLSRCDRNAFFRHRRGSGIDWAETNARTRRGHGIARAGTGAQRRH